MRHVSPEEPRGIPERDAIRSHFWGATNKLEQKENLYHQVPGIPC